MSQDRSVLVVTTTVRHPPQPGVVPGRASAAGFTVGVEQEFVLTDPATGEAVLLAPDLLRLLDGEPGATTEFTRFQLETATAVCTELGQVRSELRRLRRLAVDAAERIGCRIVASGVAPCGEPPGAFEVTENARYLELARRFASLIPHGGTCGCHVHVGISSRELGTQVLARLRPWLPQLLAISANSPIARGADTGWASWRYPTWSQWPTVRPPEVWSDAADYDNTVRDLVDSGAAIDSRSVHFHARLSPRYPTVEVRVEDSCLTVEDTVLIAGLVRAAVATAVDEVRRGVSVPPVRTDTLLAALSAAARHGLPGPGVDVFSGQVVSQPELIDRFLEHVRRALRELEDDDEVERLLDTVVGQGGGASRQRLIYANSASMSEFVEALAAVTSTR